MYSSLPWCGKSQKNRPYGGRVVTVQGAPDDDALGLAYDDPVTSLTPSALMALCLYSGWSVAVFRSCYIVS